MEAVLIAIFVLGYLAITLEHSLKVDKLIPALVMMALSWAVISLNIDQITQWFTPSEGLDSSFSALLTEEKLHFLEESMLHHFGKTAEILIFLMGAMAIVEMIDHFQGFESIKKLITTKSKRKLVWIISILAFVLSAIIDNLTTTIVLITILRKLISDNQTRMWYAAMVIIAANAGGAWTPIGDVTTTMLWMAEKVSSVKLIQFVLLPSLVNLLVPLLIATFLPAFKGEINEVIEPREKSVNGRIMLITGLLLIVAVPVFKTVTHLPPYVGMMLSLAILAILAEILSKRELKLTYGGVDGELPSHGPTMHALSRIEIPSILFFLGILMTVAALESTGIIFSFGQSVSETIPQNLFVSILGASSAVIDNVPLVAASMGMFQEASDASVWHFIAYAAGTGGSILIIGSAAGVVAMGMEKISFIWYLKNIAWLALLGYVAGASIMYF